uniref:Uncharacterized protein n=1 Tax=Glossina morsitans morsitans TaxID=37546 RepID=A0A1B0FMU7_GLOMM
MPKQGMLEPPRVTRACKGEGSHAEPTVLTEEGDTIDDVVIVAPEKNPITIRAMIVIYRSKTTTTACKKQPCVNTSDWKVAMQEEMEFMGAYSTCLRTEPQTTKKS